MMKTMPLAYCQGTEFHLVDDWLNSTFSTWTYSLVIRNGRDIKNCSALLFYIGETKPQFMNAKLSVK